MPKLLQARPPLDAREAHQVRKLATSTPAPADWILHAKLLVRRWQGQRTSGIAAAVGCTPQTVRERVHACNERGLDGLGMRSGGGRTPRLTEAERRALMGLVAPPPPGRLVRPPEGTRVPAHPTGGDESEWALEARAAAAQAQGIQVGRSQSRRLLQRAGVRWGRTPSWGARTAQDCAPQGPRSSPVTRTRRPARGPAASMNAGR